MSEEGSGSGWGEATRLAPPLSRSKQVKTTLNFKTEKVHNIKKTSNNKKQQKLSPFNSFETPATTLKLLAEMRY